MIKEVDWAMKPRGDSLDELFTERSDSAFQENPNHGQDTKKPIYVSF